LSAPEHFVYRLLPFVSAVRGHNVARVSKSYDSYDRFTTSIIEDLATSDLSQAVKGLS
jgi:hypothetical protein